MNLDVGSDILTEVSAINDYSKKSSKLNFHLHAMEDEMRKIEAFKRELPICMHLLQYAIERLKEESQREKEAVREEFALLKNDDRGDGRAKMSNDFNEKKNWMSSVQLWSTPTVTYENYFVTTNQDSVFHLTSGYEKREANESQFQGSNFRNQAGAFVPFKKPSMKEKEGTAQIDDLSLPIPEAEVESTVKGGCGIGRPDLQKPYQHEPQRKQRRCWSPELHNRFVNALRQLGGALTATPKQIREFMKADGLTNDEVKSHLQKYRIHIKKLTNSPSLAREMCHISAPHMVL